jgi:hypothetical protein
MLDGILERGEQSRVFGVVISLFAEMFVETCDLVSAAVIDHDAIAGWSRIAASATIGICGNQVRGSLGLRR